MEISGFVWNDERIEHIGRHSVLPEEFEEVCFGDALVLRAKSTGKNPVYSSWVRPRRAGSTMCRYLLPRRKGVSCNCRDMTDAEKRRYAGWKKP